MITLEQWRHHKVGCPLYVVGGGFDILWRVIAIEHSPFDEYIAYASGREDTIHFCGRGWINITNTFESLDEAEKVVKKVNKKICGKEGRGNRKFWEGI